MHKHCTLLKRNSRSVFLKDIAQTKTFALLFPEYHLVWEHPVKAQTLLLLDTSINPLHFTGDFSWLSDIERVEVLPDCVVGFRKILKREVFEVKP